MKATRKSLNMVLILREKDIKSGYDSYPYPYPYRNEITLKTMKKAVFSVK